jgi:endonuclease III
MARPPSKPDAPVKSPRETAAIMALLFEQHPNAFTELDFRTPFELLAATIMSAQSTDKRVNEVTPALFKKFPDARAMAKAPQADLESDIKTTGFFRQKAKALIGMAQALVNEHGGEVPADMDALTALPGVGRKTANVVLGHALGVPGLPVDRHVLRVANRIGIAQAETPEEVETQLTEAMPRDKWTVTSDTLILHGRRICRPKPECDKCLVVEHCEYARAWYKAEGMTTTATRASASASAKVSSTRKPGKKTAKTAAATSKPDAKAPRLVAKAGAGAGIKANVAVGKSTSKAKVAVAALAKPERRGSR